MQIPIILQRAPLRVVVRASTMLMEMISELLKRFSRGLLAYTTMHERSPVYLDSYVQENVRQLRVLARTDIQEGELLYSLIGTVADDAVAEHSHLSAILGGPEQQDIHVLTGPLRFINSDCNPNAHVRLLCFVHTPALNFIL